MLGVFPQFIMAAGVFGLTSTSTGDIHTASNFRIAMNQTVSVNKALDFDIQIEATQTIGPAPLGVHFDAFSNSSFPGVADPRKECSFFWNFDSAGQIFQSIAADFPKGNDANIGRGSFIVHAFEEGVHTVICEVYHHLTGKIGYGVKTIDATNSDAAFPTSQTGYIDPTGNFANDIPGCTHLTTWPDAISFINNSGDRRLIADYGAKIPVNDRMVLRQNGAKYIMPVGNPIDGEIRLQLTEDFNSSWRQVIYINDKSEVKSPLITGVCFEGNYNPVTGAGTHYKVAGITDEVGGGTTVYRCRSTGVRGLVFVSDNPISGGVVIVDNIISNWADMGMYGWFEKSGARGNSIRQNPWATNGRNGKLPSEYTAPGDGVQATFAHGLDMRGDNAKNLFVGRKHVTTGQVIETPSSDYTATSVPEGDLSGTVTYTGTLPDATWEAHIHQRRYAVHGPWRSGQMFKSCFTQNDGLSVTGWSTAGGAPGESSVQPNTRIGSSTPQGQESDILDNRFEGGAQVMHLGPANDQNQTNHPHACVIDGNVLIAGKYTQYFVEAYATGSIVRNNVGIKRDFVQPTQYTYLRAFAAYAAFANAAVGNEDAPIEIIGNTVLCFTSVANNVQDITAAAHRPESVPGTESTVPTNLTVAHNAVYNLHAPTPIPDITPLNVDNFGAPQSGSSLLNSVNNSLQYLFNDLFGNLRSNPTSAGAIADIQAATLNAPTVSLDIALGSLSTGDIVDIDLTDHFTNASAFEIAGMQPKGLLIKGSRLVGAAEESDYNFAVIARGLGFTEPVISNTLNGSVSISSGDQLAATGTLDLIDASVGDIVVIDLRTLFDNATGYGVDGDFPSGYSINGYEAKIIYNAANTFTDFRFTATDGVNTVYSNLDTVTISSAPVLTNKLVNAQNTDNGSWGGKQCTPNGTLITDNASSDQHYRSQSIAAPGTGNTELLRLLTKYGNHKHIGTRLNPGGSYQNVIFDIENGVLVSMAAGFDSATITPVGAGWYLIEVVVTNRTMGEIRISMFDTDGIAHSYSGSETSSHVSDVALYDI